MKRLLIIAILSVSAVQTSLADTYIIENGEPNAEIIIAEQPQRSTRLAAADLPFGVPNGGMYKNRERMPEALAKGEWRHLAGVSSPDGLEIYVNGRLSASIPDTFRPDSLADYIEVALSGYSRHAGG